ncbi:MAG TPA: glucosamine-6-phosphate deaminase [Vicinamibacterales bacterium]|nr:glucosamine-6-phosphate deaminase [Vicinamibacterales bacterium]
MPRSPRLAVYRNERALAHAVAERIVAALAHDPHVVLGLPTGRTPIRLYHDLAALYGHGLADFSRARTFNLDEFVGLAPSHPGSYRTFMQQHLFDRVNLSPEHVHFLDGSASDPDAECRRYEAEIEQAGGIDLQVLGIGTNGHIGFNEPARELHARTHRVTLKPETRRSNAALFGGEIDRVPVEALSMGMATIMQARTIVLMAIGKSKARCIARLLNGPITPKLPASFLQLHPDVEIAVDEAAAG